MFTSKPRLRSPSRNSSETGYRSSGTTWKDDLISNESSKAINSRQDSTPADVSTSCVITAQAGALSGQNQMKGTEEIPFALMQRINAFCKIVSTVQSTGHCGN